MRMMLPVINLLIFANQYQELCGSIAVTESTIIATIHYPDIGYCLFGISLVMHIPYYVPCTLPIVIVSY